MHTLGARIRLARGKTSQEVFAGQIHVSKGSLGGYERDENLPNADVIINISKETGCSVAWLLTGEGPMFSPSGPGLSAQQPPKGEPPARHAPVYTYGLAEPRPTDTWANEEMTRYRSRLEEKLIQTEKQRDSLLAQLQAVFDENRRLWQENAQLRENLARQGNRWPDNGLEPPPDF